MSSGVGIVAALSGSFPRIAGPRPSKAAPGGSRSPNRSPDSPESGRRPVRTPESGGVSRIRPEPPGGPGPRPSRTVSVTGSPRPEGSSGAKAATLDRVVRAIAESLPPAPLRDPARIRLSLSPAHLGDLWIEVSVAGPRLRGTVRAGTAAARDLILAHLDELRRDLGDRGIRFSRLEVEVLDPSPEEVPSPEEARPRSHRRQVLDLRA